MKLSCPHCSQTLELTPDVLAALQGHPHFECPSCQGLIAIPAPPQRPLPRRAQPPARAAASQAQRGINRNLLVLGVVSLLVLGGIAAFLASRNGGSITNIFQNTTNNIIHNNYFTQLIASGTTTLEDLKSIEEIRPYGDGFIGISKAQLNWSQAGDLAKRTGSEVLAVEDSAAGTKQQLIEWLKTTFAAQFQPTLWVRQDGQAKVTDGNDVLAGTSLESTRKVALHWKANAGRTTSDPALATKEQPFENSLGMKFVPVPITGGPTDGKKVLFSIWETRVRDFESFVKESGYSWSRSSDVDQEPDHAVAGANWEDAQAFCAWLTKRERAAGRISPQSVFRLPTDHEWSCAVGIGEQEDAAKLPEEKHQKLADVFPWGSQWPPPANSGNYWSEELRSLLAAGKFHYISGELPGYRDGQATVGPVGGYAATELGLYDLGGNLWEWCEDWCNKDRKDRVLRGAPWRNFRRSDLLSSYRHRNTPGNRNDHSGFRVVLEAPDVRAVVGGNLDPRRQLVESVLSKRGFVSVVSGPGTVDVHRIEDLPPGSFRLWHVNQVEGDFDDADAALLANFPELVSVLLHRCSLKTLPIQALPNLENLELGDCGVTVESLRELAGHQKLKRAHLGAPISREVVGVLAQCPNLEYVALSDIDLRDGDLEPLVQLKRLKEVHIIANLSDAGLAPLAGIPTLEKLSLGKLNPKTVTLSTLQQVSATRVHLYHCTITPAMLDSIAQMPGLRWLYIEGGKIADDSLKPLFGMKRLGTLILKAQISEAAVDELKKALPSVSITR